MLDKLNGIFAGKKTYITAGLGIVGTIAAFLIGEATTKEAIIAIFAAIQTINIRHGIK